MPVTLICRKGSVAPAAGNNQKTRVSHSVSFLEEKDIFSRDITSLGDEQKTLLRQQFQ
jgi:hypothetical protein